MSDAYERVKGGRLLFKGGGVASRSKAIDKKSKKKKRTEKGEDDDDERIGKEIISLNLPEGSNSNSGAGSENLYTIDAAKKMKYEELFPVEAKKFGYDPKFKAKAVEDALDERVKKKADRYCK